MNTINNLMALADAYKDAAESQTYMDQSGSMYQWKVAKEKAEESREALRTALADALQEAFERGVEVHKPLKTWW